MAEERPYRYWAFISYNHHDGEWARWLHRAIETYGIPAQLAGRQTPVGDPAPTRFHPVFKDREELPVAADLNAEVVAALQDSRYLIVICSPNATKSEWVNREIEGFLALGRGDRILPIIVDGEPPDCFPAALQGREPLAADARAVGDGRNNAKLKLLAGMLGVGFDALRQRDAQRRMRRLQVAVVVASALTVGFGALALYANQQRRTAVDTLAAADFREGVRRLRTPESSSEGMAFLARALREGNHERAATRLWTAIQQRGFWIEDPGELPKTAVQNDAAGTNPRFSTVEFRGERRRPTWVARSEDGTRNVTLLSEIDAGPGYFRVWDGQGSPLTDWLNVPKSDADIRDLTRAAISADGKILAIAAMVWRDPEQLFFYNIETKQFIGGPFNAEGLGPSKQFASFRAMKFYLERPNEYLFVTGTSLGNTTAYGVTPTWAYEQRVIEQSAPVVSVAVDLTNHWLISGCADRRVYVASLNFGSKLIGAPIELATNVKSVVAIDSEHVGVIGESDEQYRFSYIAPVQCTPTGTADFEELLPGDTDEGDGETSPLGLPVLPLDKEIAKDAAGGQSIRLTSSSAIRCLDAAGRQLWDRSYRSPIWHVEFSRDGKALTVQTDSFLTEILDPVSGAPLYKAIDERLAFDRTLRPQKPLASVFNRASGLLLTRSYFWDAPNVAHWWFTVWDAKSGEELIDPIHTAQYGGDDEPGYLALLGSDGRHLLRGNAGVGKAVSTIELSPTEQLRSKLSGLAEALCGLRLRMDDSFEIPKDRLQTIRAFQVWFQSSQSRAGS